MNNLDPIRTVLLATDLSEKSHTAAEYAFAMAAACKARLILAHALDPSNQSGLTESSASELRELSRAAQAELLHLSRSLLAPHGIESQIIVRYGNPRDVIFQLQRELSPDLVVLGSGGKTGGPRSRLGSVAEALLRSLPCRVLTLGPHVCQPAFPERHRAILLSTDFSPHALAAIPVVRTFVQQFPARILLFHVCLLDGRHILPRQEELCLHRLTDLANSLSSQSISAESVLHTSLQNNIADQIRAIAEKEKVDLILMGVRSGNLESGERLHGTVAEVIRQAHSPVLTIAERAHTS